ncbi:MAG TPA: aspartyl protease family protein [Planctomycetota bacterium]
MKILRLSALLTLVAPGLGAQEPGNSGFAAECSLEQPGHWDGDGPVLVRGSVRGPQGTAEGRFLFDTGTGRTVLDQDFARRIGIEIGLNVSIAGLGGADSAAVAAVPGIDFGGYSFTEVGVALLDLSFLSFDPLPIDGILGSDLLRECIVELDLPAAKVRFAPAEWESFAEGYAFGELRWFAGTPQVQVQVDGLPAWFTLDTGNTASTSLHGPFFREHYDAAGAPHMRIHGAAGSALVWAGRLGTLVIGGHEWRGVQAFAPASLSSGGLLNSPAADGNLGMDILRHHDVLFDYARNRIGFRAADARAERPKGDLGLRVAPRGDGYQVVAVIERSAAAKARIRVGEHLLAVAGEAVAGLDRSELMNLMSGEPGSEVEVTVQASNKPPRKAKLTRKDVFPLFRLRAPAKTEDAGVAEPDDGGKGE